MAALADPGYYAERYLETAALRGELRDGLAGIPGIQTRGSVANFVFCELDTPLDAATVVERAAARGLYLRGFRSDPRLRRRAIRVTVLDRPMQGRILEILRPVLEEAARTRQQAVVPP